jgi:serine/threonine protein kinase
MAQPALQSDHVSTVPATIGKYQIINEVGRGSTGTVYLSHDPHYNRDVAIKLYNFDSGGADERAHMARKMFLSEAHMVGMLQQPNILPIYDAGEEHGRCYVVMEHVHGARTLGAYCRPDNLLRPEDVVEIVYKCARALHYAHARGVIHRDIKPSNIMLTPDRDVRIIDFGIALVAGSEISRIEGIAGSPSYMSPEQVQSLDLTAASDQYALGAVLYELLSGMRPFRGSNLAKLLHQIVYATATPLHSHRTDLPEALEEIVATAMQKEPQQRFANCQELAMALSRVHQQLRQRELRADQYEQLSQLRRLRFFHDFSHTEIQELLRAGQWVDCDAEQDIVRQGDMDDRFYVIVNGECAVMRDDRRVGTLGAGDCFGESGYVAGARRPATIRAGSAVTVLKVSATLLEQVSASCQLRFNREFLRALISRLQRGDGTAP